MIIITGAAGFIGSAVACMLNRRGEKDLILVDDIKELNCKKKANLEGVEYSDIIDKHEFLDKYCTKKMFSDSKIIHMGACSKTTESNENYLMTNNFEYTKCLASEAVSRGSYFLYASSAATYGDGSRGFSDEHEHLKSLQPLNLYGLSKHRFDLWAYESGVINSITGLKFFNVFGPNELHKEEMMSFVPKAYEQIKQRAKVFLFRSYDPEYKDGEQKRDFIYIKEAVDMLLSLMDNPECKGIYNSGSGYASTWKQLVESVFKSMGLEPDIEYIEMPDKLKDQYQYYTCADMSKTGGIKLEYSHYSLEKAIEDYVRNYLQTGLNLSGSRIS